MPHKSGAEIRQAFLDFFEKRSHRIVRSAPVFPQDDPTLLFTNAGMNQFKDVFLGTGTRDYLRAANTQKCLRVSGKHNDLEEVGRDGYHHTFFEMLGSWSFGDYFKREAIPWAWEFLTGTCGLDKDRLWVTYFGGDERSGLGPDEETRALWRETTDIAPDRILPFGPKDNFWEMGASGPCGPCSEIHFDRGRPEEKREDGRDPAIGVNAGNERFVELWNLVFIQFNRLEDGSLQPLPARHVDTGMGLERLVATINGVRSNYDTDLFVPILRELERICGRKYGGSSSEPDVAFRVIADHVRALCVAFADGVLPSNVGRGYVLRRILRRAARFGRQALGLEEHFMHRLVPAVSGIFAGIFPEIHERREHVAMLLEAEERSFGLTLDKGLALFENLVKSVRARKAVVIPGDEAYDLYATYGFPRDLVDLMASEQGMRVDSGAWDAAEAKHREASKAKESGHYVVPAIELEGLPATRSLYHESGELRLRARVRPLKLVDERVLVLDQTPFYAESGGQVGDTGHVEAPGFRFEVEDTRRAGQLTLHHGKLVEGRASALPPSAVAVVDAERRARIMANHTGTHLMHWALKEVLGPHATQQGSYVGPDRLRFDLTHPRAITLEELERIEELVNQRIVGNARLVTTEEDLDEAKSRGVTALFGERYDQRVRVVNVGDYSLELCGGTHVAATGDIGAFVILSEAAVSAGVRRIEAVTHLAAMQQIQRQRRTLREIGQLLKSSEQEIPKRIKGLQEKVQELQKARPKRSKSDLDKLAESLLREAEAVGGARLVAKRIDDLDASELSHLLNKLRGAPESSCGVLATVSEGKPQLAVFTSDDLAARGLDARKVIAAVAPLIEGGGGGSPTMARAGGKQTGGVTAAVEQGAARLREALGERS